MEEVALTMWMWMLGTARCATALLILPLAANLPRHAKVLLALPFGFFVAASGLLGGHAAVSQPDLLLLLKEVMIGVLLGFVWALPFYAAEIVGEIIDFQAGLTFTQSVDPLQGVTTSITAKLMAQFFAMTFIALGGMRMMLEVMFLSYKAWPVGSVVPSGALPVELLLHQHSSFFATALLFAAPVMLILFLLEGAAGLASSAGQRVSLSEHLSALKLVTAWAILLITIAGMASIMIQAPGYLRQSVLRLLQP